MAKATKSTGAQNDAMGVNMDPTQYLENVRKMAEEGLETTKENYEKAKAALDDVQRDVESSMNSAQEHGSKISLAAITTLRETTKSAFDHLEALVNVKSVSEAFELQTSYLRKQAEMTVDSAKQMQSMSKSAADDLSKPVKEAAENAMKNFKS